MLISCLKLVPRHFPTSEFGKCYWFPPLWLLLIRNMLKERETMLEKKKKIQISSDFQCLQSFQIRSCRPFKAFVDISILSFTLQWGHVTRSYFAPIPLQMSSLIELNALIFDSIRCMTVPQSKHYWLIAPVDYPCLLLQCGLLCICVWIMQWRCSEMLLDTKEVTTLTE